MRSAAFHRRAVQRRVDDDRNVLQSLRTGADRRRMSGGWTSAARAPRPAADLSVPSEDAAGLAFPRRRGHTCTPAQSLHHLRTASFMQPTEPARRPYAPPRLVVYGNLEALTLTASISKNMNDSVQGMSNLKT
jgi:hypothetical protein